VIHPGQPIVALSPAQLDGTLCCRCESPEEPFAPLIPYAADSPLRVCAWRHTGDGTYASWIADLAAWTEGEKA
jgi:hypothetical protein